MDDKFSSDDERLRALGESLKQVETPDTPESEITPNGMALGLKYASEFAGSVIVATMIGYFIDRFTGSTPWGMLIGLMLGSCAGVYTIVRSARNGMN